MRRLKVKPDSQEALFGTRRYHAFITDSALTTVEAGRRRREHPTAEQVIAELKQGPLEHVPPEKFVANEARLSFTVIAFNPARPAARAAGIEFEHWQTRLRKIIAGPAQLARTGQRLIVHLPRSWPRRPSGHSYGRRR